MILKASSVCVLIASLIPAAAVLAAVPVLQPAQNVPPAQASNQPKNLKVLPNDLTIHQVRDIMDGWTDALGVDCSTCHVRDTANPAPNGRPHYNYADDSKQEKRTARVMYEMTETINSRFLSTVPNSGIPVTCGTCHRGHLSPVPFSSDDEGAPAKTGDTAQP
jgi:Photosynthetic reaction centre cytochrome C subunit